MNAITKSALLAALFIIGAAAALWAVNVRGEVDVNAPLSDSPSTPALIERGAYLARAGNCMGCHSARGGQQYAGGRAIDTPFGAVYTPNLTPDNATGLGAWNASHFYRALHNGRSKDGHLLNPVFPYTNYTLVTREDSDALFAFLKSLPAASSPPLPNGLRFPYNLQASLAVWRALYFSPGKSGPDTSTGPAAVMQPQQTAQWRRGAYLVNGVGHCSACHTARNALGGEDVSNNLGGGLIAVQNWYAPSLVSPHEASTAAWTTEETVRLLKTGVAREASIGGPMAEVVQGGTQYLTDQDVNAMAVYLKSLPQDNRPSQKIAALPSATITTQGALLYEQHCAQCHGVDGKGQRLADIAGPAGGTMAYPALAGNRAVTMPQTANLVQVVLNGGYPASTAGNPRPFGMPPFVLMLSDDDIAAVLTHIRSAWGNQAALVSPLDVNRIRAKQADGF